MSAAPRSVPLRRRRYHDEPADQFDQLARWATVGPPEFRHRASDLAAARTTRRTRAGSYDREMQLAGPELIVLGIVVVAVVIVVFLANQSGSRTRASLPESKTISMIERADRWLARVATNLNGLPSHRVEWTSPDTLQLYWTRRPIWTFAVAIVFFPIGLLALLHTNTLIGSFRIVEHGPPGTVNIDGAFSQAAVDSVNRTIPD